MDSNHVSQRIRPGVLPVKLLHRYMSDTPLTRTIKAVWIHPPLWNIPPLLTVLLEIKVSGR